MKRFSFALVSILMATQVFAQVRIDSSFAYATIPVKNYSIYIPSSYNSAVPNQMAVGFHPLNVLTWDAISWCDTLTDFSEMNNLILVCPDGGPDGNVTDSIDYEFTSALIDSMKLWYNIDTNRIYGMGFSMGGVATYEYGLDHTPTFGGFIPIGAAITSAASFSNTIGNAEGMPYYVVHGALDNASVRYTPMIDSLNSNCAIVNSLLMPGVGHTINFPNRNQILTDAYKWVDSVNLAPRDVNTVFSLTAPITGSSYTVSGFRTKPVTFSWTPSLYAPSCTKYEVIMDDITGNFSTSFFTQESENGGKDTSLTLSYHELDSILDGLSITSGNTLTLKWAVKATYYNRFVDTSKIFTLSLTRGNLGFRLSSPSDKLSLNLVASGVRLFNWDDFTQPSISYELVLDTIGGDSTQPFVSYPSANSGVGSLLTLSHKELYYQFMFGKNLGPTDSVNIWWSVRATDGTLVEWAEKSRVLTLKKNDIGFELIAPVTKSKLFSNSGVTYHFYWDSVTAPNVTYEWMLDTITGDFTNIPNTVFTSNNLGVNASFDMDSLLTDSILNVFNVPFDVSFFGKWTVKATAPNGEEFAFMPFEIEIFRNLPTGILEETQSSPFTVFPNPTTKLIHLSAPQGFSGTAPYLIHSLSGQVVSSSFVSFNSSDRPTISLEGLKKGTYFMRLYTPDKTYVHKIIKE